MGIRINHKRKHTYDSTDDHSGSLSESKVSFDITTGHKHDGALARQQVHGECTGLDAHDHAIYARGYPGNDLRIIGGVSAWFVLNAGASYSTTLSYGIIFGQQPRVIATVEFNLPTPNIIVNTYAAGLETCEYKVVNNSGINGQGRIHWIAYGI